MNTLSVKFNLIENVKKCKLNQDNWNNAFEFPLFSDFGYIAGQSMNMPYLLLNNVIIKTKNIMLPRMVLRAYDYSDNPTLSVHDADSLAALLSLIHGIRLKTGDASREIYKYDLIGQPRNFLAHRNPLMQAFIDPDDIILPNAIFFEGKNGIHINAQSDLFNSIVQLKSENFKAIIYAARLYRNALWIVESEPDLSWLMLVSAAETISLRWFEIMKVKTVSDMKENLSDLATLCNKKIRSVSDNVDLGCTIKFICFLLSFLPEPPEPRPPQNMQINWDRENMYKHFNEIYRLRSNALHSGKPFPDSMSKTPIREKFFLSEHYNNSMLINTFEYIVRRSILTYWNTLLNDCSD